MQIKKTDFIEIEYTGKLKEEKLVFDTTDAKVAKENQISSPNANYGPVIICVGEGHVVRGLDKFLEGKDSGKFSVELPPEEAFGKKDAKLIAMIPSKKFLEQKVQPMPGLQVNIDGMVGIIKTVAGGRTIVDFNHPLSGKTIIYEVKINRIVTDKKEKAIALSKIIFGKQINITVEADTAKIDSAQEIPKQISDEINKKFEKLCGLNLEFIVKKDQTPQKKESTAQKPATSKQ